MGDAIMPSRQLVRQMERFAESFGESVESFISHAYWLAHVREQNSVTRGFTKLHNAGALNDDNMPDWLVRYIGTCSRNHTEEVSSIVDVVDDSDMASLDLCND